MPALKMREIVRDPLFETDAASIVGSTRGADEFVGAAEWILCRNPAFGTRLRNSDVWFLPIMECKTVDPVILYYTFDKDHVYFLSLQRTSIPEP